MPEAEFYLLTQACDAFEVFYLSKDFVAAHKAELAADPVITADIMARVTDGIEIDARAAAADIGNYVIGSYGRQIVGADRKSGLRTVPKAVILAVKHGCKILDSKVGIRERDFQLADLVPCFNI